MGRRKQPLEQLQRIAVAEIAEADLAKAAPRYPEQAVTDMASSLTEKGQQEPVLVLRTGKGTLRLITGRRRVLAARVLEWASLDGIVLEPRFAKPAAVIERLHQGKVDPWEVWDAFQLLKRECGWTQQQLGIAVGRTRDYVANLLSLGTIQEKVRALLQQEGQTPLTVRHLRHIARIAPDAQLAATERILAERLSTLLLEREPNNNGHKPPGQRLVVRPFKKKGEPDYPRGSQEWRRYQRQLITDLNRLDREEKAQRKRDSALVAEAKHRLRALKQEARNKRRRLQKELRLVVRNLI